MFPALFGCVYKFAQDQGWNSTTTLKKMCQREDVGTGSSAMCTSTHPDRETRVSAVCTSTHPEKESSVSLPVQESGLEETEVTGSQSGVLEEVPGGP